MKEDRLNMCNVLNHNFCDLAVLGKYQIQDQYTLNTSVPRSLSGLRTAPIAFHVSPAYLPTERRRGLPRRKVDHCISPTSRSGTVTTTAISYCHPINRPTSGSHSLRLAARASPI